MKPPLVGSTAELRGSWYGRELTCEVVYQPHPAAGSRSFPGQAVFGRGVVGSLRVTHSVSDIAEDFYIWLDGPEALDPMDGPADSFGVAGSSDFSMQDALEDLARRLQSVEAWLEEIKAGGVT